MQVLFTLVTYQDHAANERKAGRRYKRIFFCYSTNIIRSEHININTTSTYARAYKGRNRTTSTDRRMTGTGVMTYSIT